MYRFLTFLAAICAMYTIAVAEELYSDKYDDLDVVAILNNDVVREQYYDCFMDTGPCLTDDASFFKGNFAEAVVTKCKKCTQKQKDMFDILVEWYVAHQEEKWNALIVKFLEEAKRMNLVPDGA